MKNKTIQALLRYKVVVLMFLVIGFLAGYFVTEYIVNNNISYYEIDISSKYHPDTYLTKEYFSEILGDIAEYNETAEKKVSIANIEYEKMLEHIRIQNLSEAKHYRIQIQRKYFPTTFKNSSGELNAGVDRCEKYITTILSFADTDSLDIKFLNKPIVQEAGYYNPYYMGIGTLIGMLFISIGFFFIITHSKAKKILVDISDNQLIFKTPFHIRYWRLANRELTTVKKLCGVSILFALMFICKAFTLPSGFGALGISLTYLIFSIIGMIYGPITGIAIGLLSDTLGYFVFQSASVYFFGYTFSAMLSGLMYGLCFYRTKITFAKCLYARMFVNLIVNVLLGSIWWAIIYDLNFEAFQTYILFISLPKNLVYLLPQSILLYFILKASARPISSFGLIDSRIGENVSII